MIDNTRVNELQDKLLQAMDIINAQALNSISFDKTIVCTIEDDSEKDTGKYSVNDGSRIFAAYSVDNRLKKQDKVYVTIPEGNYENQKMIIGKKTDETDKPFNFVTPFDTIFNMTANVVDKEVQEGSLIANTLNKYGNSNYEYVTLCDVSCNYYGYTRLGLKANFKSWIKEAIKGNYGLAIILTTQTPNIASSQKIDKKDYYYTFSNNDMYGNTYAFETDYEQQLVIPLDQIKGTITNIKINFYQEANFFDKFNIPINCSLEGYKVNKITNIYELDEDGDYQLTENATMIAPNIFVKDIYLCFGYEISKFTSDFIEIYTQQSYTYKISTNTENDGKTQNRKNIKVRWVHLNNGEPIDMVAKYGYQEVNEELPYEIRWYRYQIGAEASDPYCGAYWTRISEAKEFSFDFDPDINLQSEKIKIIILYEDGNSYRSNELIFQNEEDLPLSEEAQKIANALTIIPDDGTNGNYMVYGQDNSIKDTTYSKEIRTLSAYFNLDEQAETFDIFKITDLKYITWYFPQSNTMLELVNSNRYTPVEVKINYDKDTFYIKEENGSYTNGHVYKSDETYYIQSNEDYNKVEQNSIYVPSKFYIKDYVQCTSASTYNSNQNYYTVATITDFKKLEFTEDKFNINKNLYWNAVQCTEDSEFNSNGFYCTKENNSFIEAQGLTKTDFDKNKTTYWNMTICSEEDNFNIDLEYYIQTNKDGKLIYLNPLYQDFINTEDKTIYWFFTQCNEETPFVKTKDYYIKENDEFVKITQQFLQTEFKKRFDNTQNKENYWVFKYCDNNSEYDENQVYYTNINGTLNNAIIRLFENNFNTLEDKSQFYYISQCDENSTYSADQVYFIREGNKIEKALSLTKELFNEDKTKFWFMTLCNSEALFEKEKEYYIIEDNVYIEASRNLFKKEFNNNKLNYLYGVQCKTEEAYDEKQVYYIEIEDQQFIEAIYYYFEQSFGIETASNYWVVNQCEKDSEFNNDQQYYIIADKIINYIPATNLTLYEFLNNKTNYWYLDYTLCKETKLDNQKEYFMVSTGNGGIVENDVPQYKISSYYSPEKSNNTVTCEYALNGRVYTTEKNFTFGPAGTMGTDQTLVIDFVGDINAVNADPSSAYPTIGFEIQVYDHQNKKQELLSQDVVEWAWYYNSDLAKLTDENGKKTIKFPYIIEGETKRLLYLNSEDFGINGLYILQATIGKLTTYFPIPVQLGGYSRITGPTQVIYYSTGEPSYSRDEYRLYQGSFDNEVVQNVTWEIISSEPTEFYNLIGKLEKEDYVEGVYYTKINDNTYEMSDEYNQDLDYYQLISNPYCGKVKYQFGQNGGGYFLSPLSIYVQDAPIYGVQAKTINDQILWTQPILVLQNKWPNGVINAWDGESLILDEKNSTILAASIAAGKKNSDNSFSGVMLGDWKGKDVEGAITKQTGVYGFHEGAVSYALKEDGTAFFGKDGKGRIYINGNDATIYSPNYNRDNNSQGMMIDLNDASINMTYDGKNIKIDAGATGDVSFSNMSKAPFTIGSKFAVAWDGTIYATGGNFKGTISASTLKGTDKKGDEAIYLDGYFNIPTATNTITNKPYYGYFGSLAAELPASSGLSDNEKAGIGMSAGEDLGVVKATRVNVGMSFGKGYITINHQPQSGSSYTFEDYIHIDGGGLVCAIEAENQHGIYARFAQ